MRVRTPREVAFYSAFFCALILSVGVVLFDIYSDYEIYTGEIIIGFLVSTTVIYFTVLFFIERFLNNRIRMIYKTIHNLKSGKGDNLKIDMAQDVMASINKEVQDWATDKGEEIEKLKIQEAFRRDFLGNLSHELKTPIFSIQGYILTLLEGGLDDPNINRDFLIRASKGVDRISHIIEDLDTITNLESGRLELNKKRFNIIEVALEIIDSLEPKALEKGRKLYFDDEYSPIYVFADKGRIGQVLTNLIANTIYYGIEGGTTEIRFSKIEDRVLVEVADDGPGIAAEHLTRLFERFYRVDKSRARNVGGSGLGLAIVKHIIEAHNETIDVQSTEGKGSVFSFTLKLSKKSQDSKSNKS